MSYALTVAKAEGFEILVASVDSMSEPKDIDTVVAQLRELGAELNESGKVNVLKFFSTRSAPFKSRRRFFSVLSQ
jgi:hypothetical protein